MMKQEYSHAGNNMFPTWEQDSPSVGTSIDYNRKTKRDGCGGVYLKGPPQLFYPKNLRLNRLFRIFTI